MRRLHEIEVAVLSVSAIRRVDDALAGVCPDAGAVARVSVRNERARLGVHVESIDLIVSVAAAVLVEEDGISRPRLPGDAGLRVVVIEGDLPAVRSGSANAMNRHCLAEARGDERFAPRRI